jgi:hypothetical protein
MKHILYLSTNKPVCERPWALGADFVVLERGPRNDPSCDICYQLITAHNKKQYERGGLINYPQEHSLSSENPLSLWWKDIVFISVLWLVVGLLSGVAITLAAGG